MVAFLRFKVKHMHLLGICRKIPNFSQMLYNSQIYIKDFSLHIPSYYNTAGNINIKNVTSTAQQYWQITLTIIYISWTTFQV